LVWTIEYSDTAAKQLRKLGKPIAKRIVDFLDQRIIQDNRLHVLVLQAGHRRDIYRQIN